MHKKVLYVLSPSINQFAKKKICISSKLSKKRRKHRWWQHHWDSSAFGAKFIQQDDLEKMACFELLTTEHWEQARLSKVKSERILNSSIFSLVRKVMNAVWAVYTVYTYGHCPFKNIFSVDAFPFTYFCGTNSTMCAHCSNLCVSVSRERTFWDSVSNLVV